MKLVRFALTAALLLSFVKPLLVFASDDLANLEQQINSSESQFHPIPGAEKKITWFDTKHKTQTETAVLYLHGFSASRQEVAPVAELVAKDLHANLYATRFTAHGLKDPDAFASVTAEDWYRDAEEALAISQKLGKKTLILATSTGTIFAFRLAMEHPDQVAGLALFSPNFGLKAKITELLNLPAPYNQYLTRLIVGKYREWKPKNPDHERFWDVKYSSHCLPELMRTIVWMRNADLHQVHQPVLMVYTEKDKVIDPDLIPTRFAEIASSHKELVRWTFSNDHILAGKIISPQATEPLREKVVGFFH